MRLSEQLFGADSGLRLSEELFGADSGLRLSEELFGADSKVNLFTKTEYFTNVGWSGSPNTPDRRLANNPSLTTTMTLRIASPSLVIKQAYKYKGGL